MEENKKSWKEDCLGFTIQERICEEIEKDRSL